MPLQVGKFRRIGWVGTVIGCLVLLCALVTPVGAAVSVKAQLDRDTIMSGETGSLTISVEGGTPRSIESFPANTGLTIQYRGTSQSTTIINGNASFKHILNFSVQAPQPGQYNIPSVKVVVDGNPYPTDPLQLIVTKSDASAANRYAFLKLIVPKQEIYVGELIPIEVQAYVTEAENLQNPQLKSDGFVIHKTLEPTRSQTQVGNMIYTVLSFKMSVSAAKAGQLSLGPAEMSLTLRLRVQPDPNDVFGFMGRFQRRPVTLTSDSVQVNVLPLPSANVPPNFTGAIGTFSWTVSANPTAVAAGDPITMKAVVNGRGNLDNLKFPDLNWPDFKSYAPNVSTTPEDQLGLSGTKTFEEVVVPQSASVREIPPLTLAYFDPDRKRYAELRQPAMPVTVKAAAGGQAVPTVIASKSEENTEQPENRTDIVHIKSDTGTLAALAPPLIQRPWFLLLQAIPLAGFVGSSLWRKRKDQLARNPRLRRKSETTRTVAHGIGQLRQYAAANQAHDFFASVFRLLQEQLGERLDLPASAITEAVLDERLPQRGASTDLIARLHGLFGICNQARYAQVQTHEELQQIASNLEKALHELQQLPD